MVNPTSPDDDLSVTAILIHQKPPLLATILPQSPLPRMSASDFKIPAYLAGFGPFTPVLVKNEEPHFTGLPCRILRTQPQKSG